MQRVHSCYCHLNLECRDLRAATQRSACLQSNSACCQNRAPPEFRGAKPHGNSAKIILFFQISTLRQEIASGRGRFSGNRAGTDAAIPAAAVGEPQRSPEGRAAAGTLPYRRDRRGHQNDYREECCNRILPYRIQAVENHRDVSRKGCGNEARPIGRRLRVRHWAIPPAEVSLRGGLCRAIVSRRANSPKTADTSRPAKPVTRGAVTPLPAMSPIRGEYAPRSAAWRRIRWLRRRGLSAGRGRRRMP